MRNEGSFKGFEVGVAACGVIVTVILGYGQCALAKQQRSQEERLEVQRREHEAQLEQQKRGHQLALAEMQRQAEDRRAADNIEVQVISLVSPHFSRLAGTDKQARRTSSKILAAAADFLSSKQRPGLAQMTDKILEDTPGIRSDVRTKIEEAVVIPNAASTWYVVLASLPGSDLKLAQRRQTKSFRSQRLLE